jgi:hypothetical protein
MQSLISWRYTHTYAHAGKLLTSPPDLITAFHLLLCCIQFVATHVAPEVKSTLTGTSGETSFAALCKQSGASLSGTHIRISCSHVRARGGLTTHTTTAEVMRLDADLFAPFLRSWKDSNVLGAAGDSLVFDRPTLKRWSTMMGTLYPPLCPARHNIRSRYRFLVTSAGL